MDFLGNLDKNQLALLTKPSTCTSHIPPADLRIISCQYQALQDTKLQFKALLHHCFHLAARFTKRGGRSDQRTLKSTKSQRKDLFSSIPFFSCNCCFTPNSKSSQTKFLKWPECQHCHNMRRVEPPIFAYLVLHVFKKKMNHRAKAWNAEFWAFIYIYIYGSRHII